MLEKYYSLWATEPHLTPESGLARYWDFGEGPAPEVSPLKKTRKAEPITIWFAIITARMMCLITG